MADCLAGTRRDFGKLPSLAKSNKAEGLGKAFLRRENPFWLPPKTASQILATSDSPLLCLFFMLAKPFFIEVEEYVCAR